MLIIRKLHTLFNLNKTVILFLPIALVLLGIMRLIILMMPFRIIARLFLTSAKKTYLQHRNGLAINIGKSVAIAAKYTLWESKCLVQGLTVRLILRMLSIPSIFYIGINYDNDGKLLSHAWINCANTTIIGGANSFISFKIIQHFEDK